MARRKNKQQQQQTELPIEGAGKAEGKSKGKGQPKPSNSSPPGPGPNPGDENGNGNGNHIVAEAEAAAAKPRNLDPTRIELPLHRRVDTSFLQYASYVIRDRAIPNLVDGLKPVQRRILWSLHEKDDGKLIKVATIGGHCAQYHPHGEAAINDALVVLTNKRYLIEGQAISATFSPAIRPPPPATLRFA